VVTYGNGDIKDTADIGRITIQGSSNLMQ